MKSIDSGVCHRPWSIFWWIVQAYSLTIEYQGRPIRAKYKHFRTIWEHTCDNSPTDFISSSLKWWSSMHGVDTLYAESSYLPTHKIVPHTSLHDQPCHTTMKKYEYFEGMVISLILPQKFAIRTWFCNCPQYLCLFDILVECNPNKLGQGTMSVLPNQRLSQVLSTSDQDFVSFQPILCHPHTQIRIILFHDVQRDIFPIGNLLPTVFQ